MLLCSVGAKNDLIDVFEKLLTNIGVTLPSSGKNIFNEGVPTGLSDMGCPISPAGCSNVTLGI